VISKSFCEFNYYPTARKRMLVCDVVLDSLSELTERWLITRSLKQLVMSVHN